MTEDQKKKLKSCFRIMIYSCPDWYHTTFIEYCDQFYKLLKEIIKNEQEKN